jgi:hypothetical protein
VTDNHWEISEDPEKGIHDAVILFEKIVADDRKLNKGKSYYTLYRRIRILSSEGRSWGDVEVPYIHKLQNLEDVRGRTILPDGREYQLSESQIIEKEIFKSKKMKVKQKAFSLPGMSDDCIVEYYYKIRSPSPQRLWLIQKSIHVIQGEYIWKFFQGVGKYIVENIAGNPVFFTNMTPNYLGMNTKGKLKSELRPSSEEPREVIFTIQNVPPFEAEPYSLPDIAFKWQLRHYYGGEEDPMIYWFNRSKSIKRYVDRFTNKHKRLHNVIPGIETLPTTEEKIDSAYSWVQNNIRNIDYEDREEKLEENEHVNDVIEHGYGTSDDINKTFYKMLLEMGIEAYYAYTIDRDDNYFAYDDKNPQQFNRSIVVVLSPPRKYDFYNPGAKYLPVGTSFWYNEGSQVFMAGVLDKHFVTVPYSQSKSNTIRRSQVLKMDDNFHLVGELQEILEGHPAYSLRFELSQMSDSEREDRLKEMITGSFANAEVDSVWIEGLEEKGEPLKVNCRIEITTPLQETGGHLFIKPDYLSSGHDNPFQTEKRKYPIMFDYAKEITVTSEIVIPESWSVESLPTDTTFSNLVGQCLYRFQSYENENRLEIEQSFQLNKPEWKAGSYWRVKKLYQAYKALQELTALLSKQKD